MVSNRDGVCVDSVFVLGGRGDEAIVWVVCRVRVYFSGVDDLGATIVGVPGPVGFCLAGIRAARGIFR